jgi:hypothetical protein
VERLKRYQLKREREMRKPVATIRLNRVISVKQRGVVLVLFAIGMLAIIAVAGLALDMSHAMISKTRLQNTVDAAALAAAHVLDQTSNETLATDAARDVFGANQAAAGNRELNDYLDASGAVVEFSATLDPFVPGTAPAEYVRVTMEDFTLPAWMIQVLGIDSKQVRASAVSGPSPTLGNVCDLVPLIVCGDPDAGGPFWGYQDGEVTVLKGGSQSGSQDGPIGPGNFQLARLGGSGSDVVRENLAGGFEGCAALGDTIPTEPGNSVGPVAQGINTRLGKYSGPISPGDYPPDVITEQQNTDLEYDADTDTVTLDNGNTIVNDSSDLDFSYDSGFDNYTSRVIANNYDNPPPAGAFERRNLTVTIADCTGTNTGQSNLPILGFGCYFLLQEVKQKGSEAEMYGEFIDECDANGSFGPWPTTNPGPYLIQLYKDPDSSDS